MLRIRLLAQFKRDYKRISKQGKELKLIDEVIIKLAAKAHLEKSLKDHKLAGTFKDCR